MTAPRRILVTSALPYANGHIHIGHLVEYIQTDIWVRFQRLQGNECRYVCADDTHGTAIMIRAQAEGRSCEDWIGEMNRAHQRDFAAFEISFDHYGSTHSDENRTLCKSIWQSLRERGLIVERDVSQLYDPVQGLFLADRYVKGTCPKCGSADQNGDSCDNCGATYSPTDLIDPKSTLSGATPQTRTARHWFVTVEQAHEFLQEWTQSGEHLQPGIANYLAGHFLSDALRDWDVSRPAPYFGFEIPESRDNYWYVWFDAPIGYIASTWQWCKAHGAELDDYWRSQDTEIHHFIGKDIVYFHTLFWPVVLRAAGYTLPSRVQVHGMLTVNGEKMSKSKGTFVMASTYLEHLEGSYLRYYYATKLSSRVEDLDLDVDDFIAKVNGDLVGKVANLASRSARFVERLGLSAHYPDDGGLFNEAAKQGSLITEAYERCDYGRVTRLVMALADRANEYVDRQQPWALKKDPAKAKQLQDVCTVALNLFRQVVVYLAPVLPKLARQAGELFGESLASWEASQTPLVGRQLQPFQHLAKRVDPAQVNAMLSASTEAPAAPATRPAARTDKQREAEPRTPVAECTIDDFQKLDLRVAEVLEAKEVPEARKLLELTLNLGNGARKTVFAGIKGAYTPEQLTGRRVIVLANLAPRTMKFGVSEGMVLAASGPTTRGENAGPELCLLTVDGKAEPGDKVS